MPRRKKNETAVLTVTWVKELPSRTFSRARKYAPIVEKLAENEGKLAMLATGLTSGEATSRVVALKSAAETVKGTFRFPIRRAIDDGTYSVFGVCEG